MPTHSSQRASVAERRGVDPDISGTWENVLLEGPADAIARALERSGDDARVQRDLADAVLRGRLPQPAGDWVILVQLHGHPWLFAAGTLGGNLDGKWVSSLAKRAATRAIHLGHEKVSGTSYVTVYDRGGRTALAYSSDGHDVTFRGTLRPRSWLKQFDPIDDFAPQDAIVLELDAFVPEFRAGTDWRRMSHWPKGRIAIETGQPDVLLPANVAAAVLVDFGFGPGGPAAQATVMLGQACADDDVEAARAAIAGGADRNRKDRNGYTPLRYAILGAVRSDSRGKRALTILKLICEAGVELNGKVKGAPSAAGIFADEAAEARAASGYSRRFTPPAQT